MSNEQEIANQNSRFNNLVEGWQFSLDEISANYYRIEGKDKWGHSVSRTCSEIEINETLEKCAKDARDIQKQIQEK
jgi:hypothetical protein